MQTSAASASSEHTIMATDSSRRTQTSQPPRLLDQVRHIIRMKHMSRRTEEAYVSYTRQFILFHNKRHPKDMGVSEIRAYLSHLAVERNVAASTQNVALSALLFLYREVLQIDLTHTGDACRTEPSVSELLLLYVGAEGFPSPGVSGWYIMAAYRWYTMAAQGWYTIADHCWYTYGRILTAYFHHIPFPLRRGVLRRCLSRFFTPSVAFTLADELGSPWFPFRG